MTEPMASEPAEPTTRPQDDVIEKAARAIFEAQAFRSSWGAGPSWDSEAVNQDSFRVTARALAEAGLLADPARTTELEELREQAANAFADTAKLHGMYARGGTMHLEIEPPHALVLAWVGAARAMLDDAPNYCETRVDAPKVEMEIKAAGEIDRYAFTIQRVGKVTPHEARQRAERDRDALSLLLRGMARKLVAYRKWMSGDDVPVVHRLRREAEERQGRLDAITETLAAAGRMMTSDSRDWSLSRSDVWLYGLLVSWECEEQHEHDEVMCGGDGALREVAAQHGWADEDIARIRLFRAALVGDQPPAEEPKHKTEGGMCCNGKRGCGGPGSYCCSRTVYFHRHADGSRGPFPVLGDERDDAAGDLP